MDEIFGNEFHFSLSKIESRNLKLQAPPASHEKFEILKTHNLETSK